MSLVSFRTPYIRTVSGVLGTRGSPVEVLRYKPAGRGSIPNGVTDVIFPAALWPWV